MSSAHERLADPRTGLSRAHWLALAAASALVLVVQIPGHHATAWHYFDDAAGSLVSGAGLHVYDGRPELQFGPLSIVAALPFTTLGRQAGAWTAMVAMSALGLGVVALLVDTVRRVHPLPWGRAEPRAHFVGGLLLVFVWGDVAVRTAHVDDAVAIAAAAGAVWAVASRRPALATVALGLAAAAKPWAVAFVPLAAAGAGPWRWARPAGALAIAGLTWAPFVLAEPRTLETAQHGIANEASSVLRVLGVTAARTPGWVRPAQLVGGLALGLLLVGRGRWTAVVMAGVAWRLLLDPAANRYYTVGLVFGVLVYELLRRPDRLPWGALAAAALLEVPQLHTFPPTVAGWLRLAVCLAVLAVALAPSQGIRAAPP